VPTARASNHRPLAYSRLRDIEAPMLGACYLTEWTEGLDSLFQLGEEIETYRTAEELALKLAELRKAPTRRLSLRRRGQLRALNEHSVRRSIERISQRLGLRASERGL
jgi:spore maturation protein CgeB